MCVFHILAQLASYEKCTSTNLKQLAVPQEQVGVHENLIKKHRYKFETISFVPQEWFKQIGVNKVRAIANTLKLNIIYFPIIRNPVVPTSYTYE